MTDRIHNLNILVIFIVTLFSISVYRLINESQMSGVNTYLITFLASLGFYKLLVFALYRLIQNNEILLKIFWGKLYLKGYWFYEYTFEGKKQYGITRIEQDLNGIVTFGFGIDEAGNRRTNVRSVTPLIKNNHAYDIVCVRQDIPGKSNNYSRTTLHPYPPTKNNLFSLKIPKKMRATTYILGGNHNGIIHGDVIFRKYENAKCEDDLIDFLLKKMEKEKSLEIRDNN